MAKFKEHLYGRLLGFVLPYRLLLGVSLLGFFLAAAAEAYFVRLFGNLIDAWDGLSVNPDMTIPLLMVAATAARAVGALLGETVMARVSFNVVFNIRQVLFDQLLNLPASYYDNTSQGHIVSRITFTVAQLRDTGTDVLKALVQDGLKVIVYLGALLYLNWQLTLIFIAVVPLLALLVYLASNRFRRISRRIQNSMGDVTHIVSEAVSGNRVVKMFGGKAYETDRFTAASKINRQQNLKMAVTRVFSAQINETIIVSALCLLIVLLYQPEIGGGLSSGDAVFFLSMAGMLGRPVRKLSEINAKLQRGMAAAEDIFAQLDEPEEATVATDATDAPVRAAGSIRFADVSFRYAKDRNLVLKKINFSCEPGQTVALVGRSGSGKSTLVSLIPRFYELASGQIFLDGEDIADADLQSLRRQIALVSQNVVLFNDTLRNNIAYGELADVDPGRLMDAVSRAHVAEFLPDLTDGLDTLVGDDGVLLSGGQRQRVAIARAILKDSPILIMDEATSALDNESERYIQDALVEVMAGRTTVVIAHRLSTVESADEIIVMDQGCIVERGKHGALLAQQGVYAELHAAQFQDELAPVSNEAGQVAAASGQSNRTSVWQRSMILSEPTNRLVDAWYSGAGWTRWLLPFSWAFAVLSRWKMRQAKRWQQQHSRSPLPVIVVGNLTVGGTGKTPLVLYLVESLLQMGFNPGIVMRGYKGSLSKRGALLEQDCDPLQYGDEATMLRARTHVPIAVGADRARSLQRLESAGCDIVVSDDGLQHLAMARDIEIVVVDGTRGLGNGRLLPAGPLRESADRLQQVDWVVVNGGDGDGFDYTDSLHMEMQVRYFQNLASSAQLTPEAFCQQYSEVNAVCAIGNPQRFFGTLVSLGLNLHTYSFADHHLFEVSDLQSLVNLPVVCTEKDAVKLRGLECDKEFIWVCSIAPHFDSDVYARLQDLLRRKAIAPQSVLSGLAASSDLVG